MLIFSTDLSYHCPMPWFQNPRPGEWEVSPVPQYSVSAYAKFRKTGQPAVTIYCNVIDDSVEEITDAWKTCVLQSNRDSKMRLLDHWTLFGTSLTKARESCRVYEGLYDIYVSVSRLCEEYANKTVYKVDRNVEQPHGPSAKSRLGPPQ
jgi:hypothetical protein